MSRLRLAALCIAVSAFAGFNVVDGDMPGEYFGNAQNSDFQYAISGETDMSNDDRDFLASVSRSSLAGRIYGRVRVSPFSRIVAKKFVEITSGVLTQIGGLNIKDDNFNGAVAAGYSLTKKLSVEAEYIQFERNAFSVPTSILNNVTTFSGRLKVHALSMIGRYHFDPIELTIAGSPIMPYSEGGLGYARHDTSKLNNTNLALNTVAAADRAAPAVSAAFGVVTRPSNNLSLDMGYRLSYLGTARIAKINNTTIEAERVYVHGMYLGALYHF